VVFPQMTHEVRAHVGHDSIFGLLFADTVPGLAASAAAKRCVLRTTLNLKALILAKPAAIMLTKPVAGGSVRRLRLATRAWRGGC
jgi:hypothetical protein